MPNLIRALTKEEYFVQFKYLLLKIYTHWAREMNQWAMALATQT